MPEGIEQKAMLILEIGYYGLPDARSAGTVIERLANAFAQETRSTAPGNRLEIAYLQIASLHAFLELANTVADLYEQRKLLGNFVQGIATSIQLILATGVDPVPLSASVRTFLKALVAPMSRGEASHAKVYVRGNNNTVVFIDGAQAEQIARFLEPAKKATDSALVGAEVPEPEGAPSTVRRFAGAYMDSPLLVVREPNEQPALPEAPTLRDAEPRVATLVRMGPATYVRPHGSGGLMVPVAGPQPPFDRAEPGTMVDGVLHFSGTTPALFEITGFYRPKLHMLEDGLDIGRLSRRPIVFQPGRKDWNRARHGVEFSGYDDTEQVPFLISVEALGELGGVQGALPSREDALQLFDDHSDEIFANAAKAYADGRPLSSGHILLTTADFLRRPL
ncbi:hypothetical protein HNP52_000772 [Sphingomonas kyeonggiensis]|uniref:Uncharacterized protein n=1 Tax=Sphingomonas kyeonggiensis TaxID=1268553 RepID=A0A7W7NRF2_9SPHN|nr:DUF1488 domain-containing protein [Sphingomonas kyeonggiensis]MBB4837721.1 hypothetical protein [Sphingomonas kyeonggiensis]